MQACLPIFSEFNGFQDCENNILDNSLKTFSLQASNANLLYFHLKNILLLENKIANILIGRKR